jgi:hypothetical protein
VIIVTLQLIGALPRRMVHQPLYGLTIPQMLFYDGIYIVKRQM